MSTTPERLFHKLGANRKEIAQKRPRRDRNFSQSRDVWEDRSERQVRIGLRGQRHV
jgi:hypothetical protein